MQQAIGLGKEIQTLILGDIKLNVPLCNILGYSIFGNSTAKLWLHINECKAL